MKTKLNINQILILLSLIIFSLWVFGKHSLDLNISENNNNTITISGKAENYVAPDTAKISFSVNEYRKSQKEAADLVNKKVKKVVSALKDLGIDEKYIKTKNYNLYPQYNWNNGRRTFDKYRASQSVEVLIKDLDKTSEVLAKIVELKVDNISGPNMFIDNLDEIKDELRAEAIKNAKAKAKKLASELGVSLDKIVAFSENDRGYNYPQPIYAKSMAYDGAVEEKVSLPEINPGEDKIIKNVSITFQINN